MTTSNAPSISQFADTLDVEGAATGTDTARPSGPTALTPRPLWSRGPAPRRPDPTSSSRAIILQFVHENPGICIQEIADRMGHTRTAAVHHVRRLVGQGRVVAVRKGRRVLHFLPDETKPRQRAFLGLLRIATVQRILSALRDNPSISWRQLARHCEVAPHTIRWHLQRLSQEGVVEIRSTGDGEGRMVLVHPEAQLGLGSAGAPPGREALDAGAPT